MSQKYSGTFLMVSFLTLGFSLSALAQGYEGLMAPQEGFKETPSPRSNYSHPDIDKKVTDMYNYNIDTLNSIELKNPSGVNPKDMIGYIEALKQQSNNGGRALTQKEILRQAREMRERKNAERDQVLHKQQAAQLQKLTEEKIKENRERNETLLRQGKTRTR